MFERPDPDASVEGLGRHPRTIRRRAAQSVAVDRLIPVSIQSSLHHTIIEEGQSGSRRRAVLPANLKSISDV